jgi:hypothetical protein
VKSTVAAPAKGGRAETTRECFAVFRGMKIAAEMELLRSMRVIEIAV